jgi:hypothetical protein
MDALVRDRVGLLCDQLSRFPTLRSTIADAGASTELAELLTKLADAHEPDQARILALLNAIEQACAGVGLAGLTSRTKGFDVGLTLPGGLDADPGLAGWTCPLRRCDRVVIRQEAVGTTTPTCAARQNAPMMPYSLPPR